MHQHYKMIDSHTIEFVAYKFRVSMIVDKLKEFCKINPRVSLELCNSILEICGVQTDKCDDCTKEGDIVSKILNYCLSKKNMIRCKAFDKLYKLI